MNYDIEKLRNEANVSADKEFEKKYHGVEREAIQSMSDEELEGVVGGAIFGKPPTYTGGTGGTSNVY